MKVHMYGAIIGICSIYIEQRDLVFYTRRRKEMNIKKFAAALFASALLLGCGSSQATTEPAATEEKPAEEAKEEVAAEPENIKIDSLNLQFVPSRPAEEIITTTDGLGDLLIKELANHGYDVGSVDISVSSSFEAAGEALSAGSVDLAWLPSGTYILYSDETDVILTATRAGLSNDSENPADWNGLENKTERSGSQVAYYKALIYAGPSPKGQELAAKVNAGEALTWEDLDSATWCISSNPSSNAGYSFPTMWLMENYDGKKLTDLSHTIQDNYAGAFQKLAAEQVDITVCYADGRTDYEEDWETPTTETTSKGAGWGRPASIWEEVNVIGVTSNIYNDTIAITKAKPEVYNPEFIKAFQDSMTAISATPEGKDIIAIYTHEGYLPATDADYDGMRAALSAIQE